MEDAPKDQRGDRAIIGLMAGTSVDGIDAALVYTDGERVTRRGAADTFAYHPQTRAAIFAAYQNPHEIPDNLPMRIARDHAHAVERLMITSGIQPDRIGFHGQTIFHNPDQGVSLQIGDAQYLADRIGVPVVHQFRQADLAAGGQGAPLAPIYHQMILSGLGLNLPAAMVNIGGISNVTLWDGRDLIGYDSGPGNALIDDAMARHTGKAFDEGGQMAAKGQVDQAFVAICLQHPFFHQRGVKSLDRMALYDWIDLSALDHHSTPDQIASLTALTAASIAASLDVNLSREFHHVVVSGGGSLNPTLMAMIQSYSKAAVSRLDDHGLDSRFTEAELMAVLAARHERGLPITFPQTTGVDKPMTGGNMLMPRLK